MNKRMFPSVIIITIMILLICTSSVFAASYKDIKDHWAQSTIKEWSTNGVLQGYNGNFRPNDSITRGEMAVIINRTLKFTDVAKNTFNDLSNGEWYTEPILKLKAAEIMLGDGKSMRPMDNITREEATVIIARACGINGSEMNTPFLDADSIAPWAKDYVSTMTVLQYIEGNNNCFYPKNNITRAETIKLLDNIQNKGALVIGEAPIKKAEEVIIKKENVATESPNPIINSGINATAQKGIDVSQHQGLIDWEKVKGDGIDFAIIRVGNRGYTSGNVYLDAKFKDNIENATKAGLDIGIYFFSQAITVDEAKAEADFVVSQIKNYKITYPVVYDWEDIHGKSPRTNGISSSTLTKCAQTFCNTISAANYKPMVYFNKYIGLKLYDLTQLTNNAFWYASYVDTPSLPYDFKIWQYTNKGKVNGINGNVDMDISYIDYGI
ncbi:MAG: GH25 family lysozyme [Clostridiales bacterium]